MSAAPGPSTDSLREFGYSPSSAIMLVLETQICSNAIDGLGNDLSITRISHLLTCDLASEKLYISAENGCG